MGRTLAEAKELIARYFDSIKGKETDVDGWASCEMVLCRNCVLFNQADDTSSCTRLFFEEDTLDKMQEALDAKAIENLKVDDLVWVSSDNKDWVLRHYWRKSTDKNGDLVFEVFRIGRTYLTAMFSLQHTGFPIASAIIKWKYIRIPTEKELQELREVGS